MNQICVFLFKKLLMRNSGDSADLLLDQILRAFLGVSVLEHDRPCGMSAT